MPLTGQIEFIPAPAPMANAVTKFGGQPAWHGAPQWPLSRTTGNPMRFLCQVALDERLFPGALGKMAYVFMTDEDDYVDGTWEPDGGENAVVVQPGAAPSHVAVAARATGPTLYDMVEVPGRDRPAPCGREYEARLSIRDEPAFQPEDARCDWSEDDFARYATALEGNKVGGAPIFLQGDEFPDGGPWRLLLQLDAVRVPFSVNFGDRGIGYAFIDAAGQTAKLLWQCL